MHRDNWRMFQGFQACRSEDGIAMRVGGDGPPLLLLHGYPQTHVMWHGVAPHLAREFTIVVADLPGYGDSEPPQLEMDHAPHSKRAWGTVPFEMVTGMAGTELGFEATFAESVGNRPRMEGSRIARRGGGPRRWRRCARTTALVSASTPTLIVMTAPPDGGSPHRCSYCGPAVVRSGCGMTR